MAHAADKEIIPGQLNEGNEILWVVMERGGQLLLITKSKEDYCFSTFLPPCSSDASHGIESHIVAVTVSFIGASYFQSCCEMSLDAVNIEQGSICGPVSK